jgi:hypothetical protein
MCAVFTQTIGVPDCLMNVIRNERHAVEWVAAGFSAENADAWLQIDATLSAEQARIWREAGFTPGEIDA